MRVSESGQSNSAIVSNISKSVSAKNVSREINNEPDKVNSTVTLNSEPKETREQVEKAVNAMNNLLTTTNSTSKFLYHEGLDRYYVTLVDKETEEVVKEIPPKNLLDAYYEMQKMLGIIVDEKI
jgi:flagellar protein FlaG